MILGTRTSHTNVSFKHGLVIQGALAEGLSGPAIPSRDTAANRNQVPPRLWQAYQQPGWPATRPVQGQPAHGHRTSPNKGWATPCYDSLCQASIGTVPHRYPSIGDGHRLDLNEPSQPGTQQQPNTEALPQLPVDCRMVTYQHHPCIDTGALILAYTIWDLMLPLRRTCETASPPARLAFKSASSHPQLRSRAPK